MALKQLILTRKIEEKKNLLKELRKKTEELKTRESELETALEESQTEEEVEAVEKSIAEFEEEKEKNNEDVTKLEEDIAFLENELSEVRAKEPENQVKVGQSRNVEKRNMQMLGGKENMITRGFFKGMTKEQRKDFVMQEEVRDFLERTRDLKGQKRTVTGAELTIPEVMLEMLRDNLHRYSKLIHVVKLKAVAGKARQNIAGTIPEGVWVEAIATLNELAIVFNQIEVDGYKVGGYIPIPNSTLEDSEENLAEEIMDAIGQAIGLAVDKAILYGTGTKMPLGIVTRLKQTAAPSDWGVNAPAWSNLSSSNITKLNLTAVNGVDFFAKLITTLGVAKSNYSDGKKAWCMNDKTYNELIAKAISFNAAATITSQVNGEMPIIGGKIEILPFMKDGDIIGGYMSLYLLVERKGGQFETSSHAKFIEDVTIFKGTARYDGKPVIAEGFVATNINNIAVTTEMAFAVDTANATA